ncbi:hypothetical protein K7W42_17055 [Deinococcus sp. HMF7604]|uniref:hypothetical protein n=1 Tax=Deinococcus betulae TaxID=2873312 RepID=UPI001CCC5738|nr:hypothetical protein [Deinococcus betulae]MBZ9752560.1 hypothetical protein [Deinococcus betulae]
MFSKPAPLGRISGRWLLLSALLGLAPTASAQTTLAADICAAPEDLAEVRVDGLSRGTYSLRRAGEGLWLQTEALQAGEERYGQAQVTCDGLAFTQLNPVLAAQYDAERQTLAFQARLDLLPVYTVTVSDAQAAPAASQNLPLYALEYSLEAHRLPSSVLEQRGRLQGTYANGPFSARVGITETSSSTRELELLPSAAARYQLNRDAHIEAGWNIQPLLAGGVGGFSGLQAQVTGSAVRRTDDFTVALPQPGTVTLISGGVLLGRWSFGAGRAVFRQLPLTGSAGAIVAIISDAGGQREVSAAYSFPAALLPAGSYRALGEAGRLGTLPYAGAQLSYGLTPALTLDAQAQVKAGVTSGALAVTTANQNHTLTVGLAHNSPDQGTAATVAYGGRLSSAAGLGIKAQIPLGNVQATRGEAALGYDLGGVATAVGVGYDPQQAGWYGRVQASGDLSETVRLSGAARLSERGRQVSLTLGYKPSEQWTAVVNAAAGPSGPEVRAAATYLPTPDQRVSLAYGSGVLYGAYQQRGTVEVNAGAGSNGQIDLGVEGALVYANDRVYASAARSSEVSVLLETGIPNLSIYVAGAFQGRTDAQGALVFSVSSGQPVDLRVDVQALPIEISVKDAHLLLPSPESRAVKVDWRENFEQARIVSFQTPTGAEASYATVSLDTGEEYDLDAFGTGLLPRTGQVQSGRLRLQDGSSCAVTISPQAETVRCSADPSGTDLPAD